MKKSRKALQVRLDKLNDQSRKDNVVTVRGDVNGDGKLNIMDVLLAQRSILGLGKLRAEEIARADLNGNGKVDILDILLMQKKILGL